MNAEGNTPARLAVVAIDGPSGSGKSSVAKGVARALGLAYLDTGAMYRAMTWWLIAHDIDVADAAAVAARAGDAVIESITDPDSPAIRADGEDVSQAIRDHDVTERVSLVSAVPEVRDQMVALQRDIAASSRASGRGIVLEGRDIGTAVLPDADTKVFLIADAKVRAARRAAEDGQSGRPDLGVEHTEAQLKRRDALDSGRRTSPLKQASDAVAVDSSTLTLDEVIATVVDLVRSDAGEGATQ